MRPYLSLFVLNLFCAITVYAGVYEYGSSHNNFKSSEKMGTGESGGLTLDKFNLTSDDTDLIQYVLDYGYVACDWSGSVLEVYRTRNGKVGSKKGSAKVSGKTAVTSKTGAAKLILGPNASIPYPTESYLITATGGSCVVNGKTITSNYESVVATKYIEHRPYYRLTVTAYVDTKNPENDPVFIITVD